MGAKAWPRAVPPLIGAGAAFLVATLFAASARAAEGPIRLRATFGEAAVPLDNALAWELEPREENLAFRRWVLKRQLSLGGLRIAAGKAGAKVDVTSAPELRSDSVLYLRAGPYAYSALEQLPCEGGRPRPDPRFSTPEGSRGAGQEAAKLWEELLDAQRIPLWAELRKIRAKDSKQADALVREAFLRWQTRVDFEWRRSVAWPWEWVKQIEIAGKQCGKLPLPAWDAIVEPPPVQELPDPGRLLEEEKESHWAKSGQESGRSGEPSTSASPDVREIVQKLLTRAPARRWDGMFSVRVSFPVADRKLNGQFLIDAKAARTILSPAWLAAQGRPLDRSRLKGLAVETFEWVGGRGVAPVIEGSGAELGGLVLPIERFALKEVEHFLPPEHIGACCDGVLGRDFLRRFAVELVPGRPNEVRVWNRKWFRAPSRYGFEDSAWFALRESTAGGSTFLESLCEGKPENGEYRSIALAWDPAELRAASWVDGETGARANGSKAASAEARLAWSIRCGDTRVVDGIAIEGAVETGRLRIGIPILARGNFVLDLPNGRIWFRKADLAKDVPVNRTGIRVGYGYQDAERVLKVLDVRPGSPGEALVAQGLAKGTILTQIDYEPAEDLDLWEVEQRLSGALGEKVVLQWRTRDGLKLATMQTR